MRILELLYWKYSTIETILDDIKNQGFDTIKIGPIQNFKEQKGFNWKLYDQPINFRIGNKLGSKNELNKFIQKANKKNINIIVDMNCDFIKNRNSNSQTLYKDEFEFKKMYLQKRILEFIYELNDCNINKININISKENKIIYGKIKELLKESNLNLYEKNNSYINPLLSYSSIIDNKKIAFIENYDTFLYGKETKIFDTSMINSYYELLTYNFSNTLFYPRPCYYPYNEDGNRKEDFGISFYRINELDYFDNTFLTSNDIKEANFVKVKK